MGYSFYNKKSLLFVSAIFLALFISNVATAKTYSSASAAIKVQSCYTLLYQAFLDGGLSGAQADIFAKVQCEKENGCGKKNQEVCTNDGRPWCNSGFRVAKVNILNKFNSICRTISKINEPTTNIQTLETATQASGESLRGYADLHAHMFSNEAFGGLMIWGDAFNEGGINAALPADDFAYNINGVNSGGGDLLDINAKGQRVHDSTHSALIGDPVGRALHDGAKSNNSGIALKLKKEDGSFYTPPDGTDDFLGWPKSTSITHQQMYYTWLKRAYQGGMRLMVMLAVNNEVLCMGSKRRKERECSKNMQDIDVQLDKAHALQTYVDNKSGGSGKGWFRIVKTPAQARQVIEQGKLAVVLGIETDSLFDCKKANDCDDTFIRTEIQRYYNKDVRHIFPIHDFDNQFGGAAIFKSFVNYGNKKVRGEFFDVVDCNNSDYNFKIEPVSVFTTLFALGIISAPDYVNDDKSAHCNAKGLTTKGQFLMQELMDKGMIIDIDHMSAKGVDQALGLAEERAYPLVASHVEFVDQRKETNERNRTHEQLQRIKALGGMIGIGLFKGGDHIKTIEFDDDNDPSTAAPVINSCGNSSRVFAQNYLRAVKEMGTFGVALGSDFNGVTQHPGPRFGDNKCTNPATGDSDGTQGSASVNGVSYPFSIAGFGTFNKQKTGNRTFNYNTDGLAHVGLMPDFFADLGKVGLTATDLDPVFNSAEAYIRMWERIELSNADNESPVITAPADITKEATGALTSVALGTATATDNESISNTPTASTTGPFSVGTHLVEWSVEDDAGNTGTSTQTVTITDTTAPTVTAPADIDNVEATARQTSINLGEASTSDLVDGTVIASASPLGPFSVGTHTITWSATDAKGNTGTATQNITVVDTTAPVISINDIGTIEATANLTAIDITAYASATDLVGVVSFDANNYGPYPLGTSEVTWTAKDNAGNTTTATQDIIIVDTTPPIVTPPTDITNFEATARLTPIGLGQASADDLVDGHLIATANTTGPFSVGTHTIIWSATDAKGNTGSATQIVTVVDTTAPTITTSDIGPIEATDKLTAADIATNASATDLVGVISLSADNLGPYPVGTTTVTWTAKDKAGNSSTAQQKVTIADTTPPVVTPPTNINNFEATAPLTPVNIGNGIAHDLVDGTITATPSTTGPFALGETIVIWTAVDNAGNIGTATQSIIVVDTTAPEFNVTQLKNQLWPLNKKLILSATVSGITDLVDSDPDVNITISSNQGSSSDWNISENNGVWSIELRADRAGNQGERIYNINVSVTDDSGNTKIETVSVTVPHDQGKGKKKGK